MNKKGWANKTICIIIGILLLCLWLPGTILAADDVEQLKTRLEAMNEDYEYSGSGNPMGEPVKIDELSSLNALTPIVDEVWDAYISLTFRY